MFPQPDPDQNQFDVSQNMEYIAEEIDALKFSPLAIQSEINEGNLIEGNGPENERGIDSKWHGTGSFFDNYTLLINPMYDLDGQSDVNYLFTDFNNCGNVAAYEETAYAESCSDASIESEHCENIDLEEDENVKSENYETLYLVEYENVKSVENEEYIDSDSREDAENMNFQEDDENVIIQEGDKNVIIREDDDDNIEFKYDNDFDWEEDVDVDIGKLLNSVTMDIHLSTSDNEDEDEVGCQKFTKSDYDRIFSVPGWSDYQEKVCQQLIARERKKLERRSKIDEALEKSCQISNDVVPKHKGDDNQPSEESEEERRRILEEAVLTVNTLISKVL